MASTPQFPQSIPELQSQLFQLQSTLLQQPSTALATQVSQTITNLQNLLSSQSIPNLGSQLQQIIPTLQGQLSTLQTQTSNVPILQQVIPLLQNQLQSQLSSPSSSALPPSSSPPSSSSLPPQTQRGTHQNNPQQSGQQGGGHHNNSQQGDPRGGKHHRNRKHKDGCRNNGCHDDVCCGCWGDDCGYIPFGWPCNYWPGYYAYLPVNFANYPLVGGGCGVQGVPAVSFYGNDMVLDGGNVNINGYPKYQNFDGRGSYWSDGNYYLDTRVSFSSPRALSLRSQGIIDIPPVEIPIENTNTFTSVPVAVGVNFAGYGGYNGCGPGYGNGGPGNGCGNFDNNCGPGFGNGNGGCGNNNWGNCGPCVPPLLYNQFTTVTSQIIPTNVTAVNYPGFVPRF